MPNITPFLWFDNNAEDAMNFYVSIFPDSKILEVSRYGDGGPGPKGTVMVATFELSGKRFLALNGGPVFQFTEAVSFVIDCANQEEVDHYWAKLSEAGRTDRCGWLKDRFGLSWQVVPTILSKLMRDPDPARSKRAMDAMMTMEKLDIAALQRAADGH
jgi:predicted 3-demethylubiquinone-9 3-methyltransferase (glyoxalase superfamily)